MPGAETILDKILKDARAEAESVLADARKRAEQITAKAQAAADEGQKAAQATARAEAEQRRERRMRMAVLDARKEELAMKRELIDQSFAKALTMLLGMDIAKKNAVFERMLMASAQGGETILPAQADVTIFTKGMVDSLNANLAKAGKAPVTLGAPTGAIRGGFLLSMGGMECNCSLEALLRQEREALEPEAARVLFPAKEG